MFNHYIPQSDGSYRRNSVPEHSRRPPQKPPQPPHREPAPPTPPPPPAPPPEPQQPHPQPPAVCSSSPEGLLGFLKGLLPRQIDTVDLMILFLLLLMNKDDEDGLSPMLTLALYFLL